MLTIYIIDLYTYTYTARNGCVMKYLKQIYFQNEYETRIKFEHTHQDVVNSVHTIHNTVLKLDKYLDGT